MQERHGERQLSTELVGQHGVKQPWRRKDRELGQPETIRQVSGVVQDGGMAKWILPTFVYPWI